MEIFVNGQPHHVPDGSTVSFLLARLNLVQKPIAVEVNLQLVPRAAYSDRVLNAGDQIEVVTLVGGG